MKKVHKWKLFFYISIYRTKNSINLTFIFENLL